MTREELFTQAGQSLKPCVSELFDFEGCFFWNLYNVSLNEYLPKNIYDKIIDINKFQDWLFRYSSLYKDFYSIYRDDYPNFFCDTKQVQEIYFWRAQWIYHGLAKWNFNSKSHYTINDHSVQLYTNLNTTNELREKIKSLGIVEIENQIQIKHYLMWIQLYNLINFQLLYDN